LRESLSDSQNGHVKVSATTRPSAPLRPGLRVRRFRSTHGYPALGPRPRASSHLAIFSRGADTRFSEPDCRLSTSATYFRCTDTPSSAQFSRSPGPPRLDVRSESEPAFALAAPMERQPPPLEGGLRKAANRDSRSDAALRRCKHAEDYDAESYRPIVTPLAGGASTRPPLAAVAVGRERWTARAELPQVKDPL